jgi:hypothetical protein
MLSSPARRTREAMMTTIENASVTAEAARALVFRSSTLLSTFGNEANME